MTFMPNHGTITVAGVGTGPPPISGGSFTFTPWPAVQNKYDLPEDAKRALEEMQVMMDNIGSTPPTPEQWLQVRECMLKYWAAMISHILVSDQLFNDRQYQLQLEAQQRLLEMQWLQAQRSSYAPIVTSTAKI